MDLPNVITSSRLYNRLQCDSSLLNAVQSLRNVTSSLASTVSSTVPSFTDHTVRHMDALWGIADRILTQTEFENLSCGEAFILASTFYLHDIGMAYAATAEGLQRICDSSVYKSIVAQHSSTIDKQVVEARALALAVRKLHSGAAVELATKPVPGTSIYLFDSQEMRESWGETCGRVAASHHWNLDQVERELGSPGSIPLPKGHTGDLGFVACLLRLTDYAHINRDRAPKVDRAFRREMDPSSLVHWLAQEHIDGPERDGADLVYRASSPISDVEAWWLYFEMLKGLDEEIRTVRRYIDRRTISHNRLSLQGVRGVTSPEESCAFIPTSGFLPIEINLRTGSIEKLVQLLAGESLYGPDPMAAVRELIQNSRDAVMLKAAISTTPFEKASLQIPIRVSLKTQGSSHVFEVSDAGIGMTRKVMSDYLITIASDYWNTEFFTDFPEARNRGFQPAGRFGIGFLSVFMLADEVIVISNRDGGEKHEMRLHGIGRRGEMRVLARHSGSGTTVQLPLRDSVVDSLKPLDELVRVYAPMVPHEIVVEIDGESTSIPSGWLGKLDSKQFCNWTLNAIATLTRNRGGGDRFNSDFDRQYYRLIRHGGFARSEQLDNWPKKWPEHQGERVRLVASFAGMSLLCLRGFAIQPIRTPGFVGIIDLESATPDVSRRQVTSADVKTVLSNAKSAIRPHIVENLDALVEGGLLIEKTNYLADCERLYNRRVILDTSLPWINLLKLPGEIQLVNCATLIGILTKSSSLFVAYGTGPWTAMKKWMALDKEVSNVEPAIVIDDINSDGLSYQSNPDERVGKLGAIWPTCSDVPLFGTILTLAAEAWQVNVESLADQDGWHHSGSVVWGRLVRR